MTAKPTVAELGIDLAAQVWHRSGRGDGTIEVAFARTGHSAAPAAGPRSGGPPRATPSGSCCAWQGIRDRRVLVFDRHEWECFLDGARNGEFDDAAASP